VLLISMVRNGLILFSVPPLWNEFIIGAVIIAAAMIDIQRRRLAEALPLSSISAALIPGQRVQSITPPRTFDQALNQLIQALENRFENGTISICLVNRETGELVRPDQSPCPPNSLVSQVYTTGKTITLADLRRDHEFTLLNPKSDSRAAAAVPILRAGQRIIGVLEFQTANPGALNPPELEAMMTLASQLAAPVEDNWLLEIGWLTRQIRETLRNLNDEAYLDKSELGEWLLPGMANPGQMLRRLLLDAVDYLHADHLDASSRTLRRYQILRQTYVDQKSVEAIIHDLGLSRRQYFYDLKEGIEAITHYLFTGRQNRLEVARTS
jgi:hypothetical protein